MAIILVLRNPPMIITWAADNKASSTHYSIPPSPGL